MHELSIADAILDLARRHLPPGCELKSVHVRAGPTRAIDPDAMQLAWQAVLAQEHLTHIDLILEIRPWTIRCPRCGCQWTSTDLARPCTCGHQRGVPIGGDELQLTSIEVDEITKGAALCASR
jgi:Zn finger protein HypA/HybF involved in hydrogenase expression